MLAKSMSRGAMSWCSLVGLAWAALLVGGCATGPAPSPQQQELLRVTSATADDLVVVDCLLPGRLQKLGRNMTFMTCRRPIKTTASDCEIRGGQYVLFDRADYQTALAVWMSAAEQGDPIAQTHVGQIYEGVGGVAPDYARAAVWYRRAAVQDFPRAQMKLAALYEQGLGVDKDAVQAIEWYRKASGLVDDTLVYGSSVEKLKTDLQEIGDRLRRVSRELESAKRKKSQTEAELLRLKRELDAGDKGADAGKVRSIRAVERRLSDQLVALSLEVEQKETEHSSLQGLLNVAAQ